MQASKKTKQRKPTKTEKNLKRMFTVTKILMCIFPFAALFYLYMKTREYNLAYNEILRANPVITVAFLTAMCQPFAAWLLTIVQRRVDDLDYANAYFNILLIFIAECLFKNWLGIAATAILFYMINKESPLPIKEEFKKYADWKKILFDATGGFVLILLAGFCLFCSLQIG